MAVAKFDSIEIPLVYAIEENIELIGERERTAGGKLRQDVVDYKKSWRLQTRPMTKEKADTLMNHLESIFFGPGDFWLDDFGLETTTTKAFISIDMIERVPFGDSNGWHKDGRQLTLTVTEQ